MYGLQEFSKYCNITGIDPKLSIRGIDQILMIFSRISELNRVSSNLIGRAVPNMTLYKSLQAVYITFSRPGSLYSSPPLPSRLVNMADS